ncbi:LOW QUALITY PROTEIN: Protein-kinase-like protein [Phytophthora palmivora]|uniref:Protein-kinase-like protein n=1 Tax=Phytophthora palmivora TaxID=4796 RepID=A0A2P4YL65_9STRA|nr:LOW QUALITY PROTEIN: Protein-kinase-like protein [Phytophthora palmivora]
MAHCVLWKPTFQASNANTTTISRNTPQAFSHFTYEASNHELLAVDIQGVGDLYTDPQIHTLNGHDFGKGNLGVLGFQKFLSSHRCNSICRYLKLPAVNPKSRHADSGTLPVQELMNRDRVRPTHFDSRHYYENAPMLQKYVTQCREMDSQLSSASSSNCSKRFRKRHSHEPSGFAYFCRVLFCGGY